MGCKGISFLPPFLQILFILYHSRLFARPTNKETTRDCTHIHTHTHFFPISVADKKFVVLRYNRKLVNFLATAHWAHCRDIYTHEARATQYFLAYTTRYMYLVDVLILTQWMWKIKARCGGVLEGKKRRVAGMGKLTERHIERILRKKYMYHT